MSARPSSASPASLAAVAFGTTAAVSLSAFLAVVWAASLLVDVPTSEGAATEDLRLLLGLVVLWTAALVGGHLLAGRGRARAALAARRARLAGFAAAGTLLVVLLGAGRLLFVSLDAAFGTGSPGALAVGAAVSIAVGVVLGMVATALARR